MIELWGMISPNVQKVLLMLEELEAPFQFHHVDVFMNEQFGEAFSALTPNHKVPVIRDHEGPSGAPITLWESGAILIYLAEKAGTLIPSDPAGRYATMQWLMFQMAGIGPMFGQNSHFRVFAKDEAHAYARSRYATETKRLYGVLETRLSQSRYLAGDEYTIADVAAFPWVRNPQFRGVEVAEDSAVARYVADIEARPAAGRMLDFVARMQRYDIDKFAVDHPQELDRYLGRGAFAKP